MVITLTRGTFENQFRIIAKSFFVQSLMLPCNVFMSKKNVQNVLIKIKEQVIQNVFLIINLFW